MGQSFRNYVGILGDPACRPNWQENFMRMAGILWETYRPSHVFVPGDVTPYGTVEQHEEMLALCRKFPCEWVVAMGDHDAPVEIFERYWGPARKVTDVGGWRFIGVDTAGRLFTEENATWLREQIKPKTIIYCHMPPKIPGWEFHSLSQDCTARFLSVLDESKDHIHACFFGHIHVYDRKIYHDIPMILTGAGGAAAYELGQGGYGEPRPRQAIAFDTNTGEILLVEDEI